nr:hypothetical protein [Tanacetum cinerariifolium]
TYTSVYIDSEPWRFQQVSDEEPEALVKAPPSPDYVSGPKNSPSPNYVPGLEEPEHASLSPDYVLEPEYPEYLENPEEDHADYPADERDNDDDESSDDDDDDDDDEEEEDDEHLALTDSTALYASSSAVSDIGIWGQMDILAVRSLGDGTGVGAHLSVLNASISSAEKIGSTAYNALD